MADKRTMSTYSSLLDTSAKKSKLLTSTNMSLTSGLLSSSLGGTTSSSLGLSSLGSSSLLSKPSSLTSSSSLSLTSKLSLGTTKSSLESGLLGLSLQSSSLLKEPKLTEKKKLNTLDKSSTHKRSLDKNGKTQKRSKTAENSSGHISAKVIKQYTIDAPDYSLMCDEDEEDMDMEIPDFVSPDKDLNLITIGKRSLSDVTGLKRGLINLVSGSLISQPNFSNTKDATRHVLTDSVESLVVYDAEFILKVALYSRKELNIRTTSNFLLALASSFDECRQYLKKYYCASIALPSDWIEVAEIYQTLEGTSLKRGALPSALRKVMIAKFTDFDEYQLAKYNKQSSGKKKNKKAMEKKAKEQAAKRRRLYDSDSSDSEDDEDNRKAHRQLSGVSYDEKMTEAQLSQQRFTIKQLIRKLHITTPVEYVMCIIGKKYPDSFDKFYQARLPGTFEEDRAGKRMRLPIPETWETQVSLKGNKAQTWEDLIDHKKLPFMAMLRNLRNLIKAGISEKHHNAIIRRLTDRRQVVNSKQFPFRFFSAYVVLQELRQDYERNQQEIIAAATDAASGSSYRPRGRSGLGSKKKVAWWIRKKEQKKESDRHKEVPFDNQLIDRYVKAVDTSVKIATTYNVQPIKGRTIILCDVSDEMDQPCSSAKGLGKPRTLREISTLMSLMCQHACESCTFIVFKETGYQVVEHKDDLILDRLEKILEESVDIDEKEMHQGLPYDVLFEAFRDKIQVDNLLVFSQDIYPDSSKGKILNDFLCQYRHSVNPNLLFLGMVFSSPKPGFDSSIKPRHENDIYISGYSDAILRFIAERGDSGLLQHVDKIDEAFQLRPMPKATFGGNTKPRLNDENAPDNKLQIGVPLPGWKTLTVFISSTFRDMHGERDLLTRFVFPELRSIARRHFVNVYEVDLRWGITEEEAKNHQTLSVCLREASRSDLFIGLLGERYGWVPDKSKVPDTPEYDWVHEYAQDASVTELEMYYGALHKTDMKDKAFFFLRDNEFEKDVPKEFLKDFKAEDTNSKARIQSLKKKIRHSGFQVFDNYPCHWGGYCDGKPMVAGLEDFGARVLNTLVNSVKKLSPAAEEDGVSEEARINNQHWEAVYEHKDEFVGRGNLIKQIINKISSTSYGVVGLTGKAGCGKTALMAATIVDYKVSRQGQEDYNILINIAGAAPGSNNLSATLRRLAHLINTKFVLGHTLPEDYKNLVVKFEELLCEAGNVCPSKVVLFFDGLDVMETSNQPCSLEWLPARIPDNVVIVLTAVDGGVTAKSLKRIGAFEVNAGALDMWDKAEIVRQNLAKHRKALNESGFGNEMKLLMLKKDAHNPLYLKLACEELRVFGVFEKISDKLKSLPHTTAQMLQDILFRLETDHGRDLICLCLSLLACARDGLSMEELYDLVNWARSMRHLDDFEAEDILTTRDLEEEIKLPYFNFAFLGRSIMSFLNPGSEWCPVITLGNAEIRTAVRLRYMKGSSNWEERMHKLLAGYFWLQADPSALNEWKGLKAKAVAQLPYHLASSRSFKPLENILCNHWFIQAKCTLGLAAGLLDDFELKGSGISDKEAAKFFALPKVQQYKSFVSRNIEILVNYPSLELQQALNEPTNTMPYTDALKEEQEMKTNPAYMLWMDRPQKESQCYRTMSNLKTAANCIKINPTGTCFATGSSDAIVRLYDKATGKELSSFMGHSDAITDICFVNNKVLCSASADTTLSVWDTEFGHRIHTLKGHNRRVDACAADSSGQTIASGGWDGLVILWSVANGKSVHTFEIGCPVNSLHFHPEFELLAVASWDSKIRIFNTFHRKRVAILSGHQQSVRDVVFSKDGKHLASADMDGAVKIWDSKKGTVVGSVKGHSEPINKVLFSPTGKELITASNDHQVKMWSGELGFPLRCLAQEKFGAATSVAMSKDGSKIAIGYHAGIVRIHSVDTGLQLMELRVCTSPIRTLQFYRQKEKRSNYLLAGCDDNFVQVIDLKSHSLMQKLTGHSKPVLCVTSNKDFVVTGGEDCAICVYAYKPEGSGRKGDVTPTQVIRHHTAPVTSLCFHTDTIFISSSRDSSLCYFTTSGGDALVKMYQSCHADWINSASKDSVTSLVATGSNDFNVKVWDVDGCKEKHILQGHSGSVNTIDFDHGYIASGSSDNTVKMWSHKGVDITTLHGHSLRVNACVLHTNADGKEGKVEIDRLVVASAGDDGDVWLWKPLLANQLVSLSGHSNRVLSVTADREGQLTSCSMDGSIKMWKPCLGGGNTESPVHDAPVNFIAMSKGGNYAVTGSRDGVVKIWKADSYHQPMTMAFTFQAHTKSVTCGTFIRDHTNAFVTGGNDDRLVEWEIVDQKNGFFIREIRNYPVLGPFAAMHYDTLTRQLFVSNVFGNIFTVNASGGIHCMRRMDRHVIKSWVTCMEMSESSQPQLIVCDSQNAIEFLPLDTNKTTLRERKVIADSSIEESETTYPPNWVNCMIQDRDWVLAGDSRGQICMAGPNRHQESTIKVHKSDITAMEIFKDTLFTASKDASIKVWTVSRDSEMRELRQVGQFFTSAPVTSMKIASTSVGHPAPRVILMVGDFLGNVKILKWHQTSA